MERGDREPGRHEHGRDRERQALGGGEEGDLPRAGAARAQERRVDPAVVREQRRRQDHRVRGEQRQLGHDEQDAGAAHEQRSLRGAEDRGQPRGDLEVLAGLDLEALAEPVDAPAQLRGAIRAQLLVARVCPPAELH